MPVRRQRHGGPLVKSTTFGQPRCWSRTDRSSEECTSEDARTRPNKTTKHLFTSLVNVIRTCGRQFENKSPPNHDEAVKSFVSAVNEHGRGFDGEVQCRCAQSRLCFVNSRRRTNLALTCLFRHWVRWEMGQEMARKSGSTLLWQSRLKNKTRMLHVPDAAIHRLWRKWPGS